MIICVYHVIGTTRNKISGRMHINARKYARLFAPNNSNLSPTPKKPIKPKPIPVVTEIRTYCPNNNSITNGDGNCTYPLQKIEQESDDNNNNDSKYSDKNRIILFKNYCTLKPPVAAFRSKQFEEIF